MRGQQLVGAWLEAHVTEDRACPQRRRQMVAKGVEHHVADDMDSFSDSLARQVAHGHLARTQEEVAQVVGDDPVDLLGHAPVVTA